MAMNDADGMGEGEHPAGVWRALAIFCLAAAFAWIPYLVPGLEKFQVLGPDDPLPLSGVFSLEAQPGGGLFDQRALLADDEKALMRVAPLPPAIELEPEPSQPSEPPRGAEQRGQPPLARIEREALEGLTREIEDPQGAMRHFYAQLAKAARGEPGLARMSVYGTSINGSDRMTSQLRRLLQERFGDGGKGWVPISPGWRYQSHQDVAWSYDHWRTFVVNRSNGPLDRYGFGGVLAVNRHRRAVARFGTVNEAPGRGVSTFRIFYQAWPGGGDLGIRVDGGESRHLSTRAAEVEDRVEVVEVPDGAHTLTLRATGDEDGGGEEDLRLYGVVMERPGPGVVVDGLGLIGAFTRVLRLFDEDHLTTQVRQRESDLLVFWMGANDAVSESVPYDEGEYVGHYREILRRFKRARPEASCLVMSILDKGEQANGYIRTRPRVPEMVETQREIAFAEGCAFFDSYQAAGGDGTMRRWYRARPRLVTADLGHLTAAGSRVVGTLFHRALLKGFDDWIAEGEPSTGE